MIFVCFWFMRNGCNACAAVCSVQTFRFLLLFRRYMDIRLLTVTGKFSSAFFVQCQMPEAAAAACMVVHGSCWLQCCRASPDFACWFVHTRKLYCVCVLLCFDLFYKMSRVHTCTLPYVFLNCVACERKHCLFIVVSTIRHVIVSEQVKHYSLIIGQPFVGSNYVS